jgi:hypothetical protein
VLSCSPRTSKSKPLRSPSFSFRSSKTSHLEHIALIFIFSIYSIELELHDRSKLAHTYARELLER